MKPRNLNWLALGTGLLLLAAGLLALKWAPARQGALVALPYVCIGLGCGALGSGISGVVNRKIMRDNPQLQKQLAIEQSDERNIALSNRAKAFDAMLYIFSAALLALSLMKLPLMAILILTGAYLAVIGYFIFYLNKYHKEM